MQRGQEHERGQERGQHGRRAIAATIVAALVATTMVLAATPATAAALTLTVSTVADGNDATPGDGTCATSGGPCSLRAAIQEANARPGDTVTIRFSVAGTIDVTAIGPLPPIISAGATIDGSTAPGYAVATGPTVTISGNAVLTNAYSGIVVAANDVTVRGLRFGKLGQAVVVGEIAARARIVGNWIGTDGSAWNPALEVGVALTINGDAAVVGTAAAADRNLVAGFLAKGIRVSDQSSGTVIENNRIGTNAAGTAAIANPNGTGSFTLASSRPTPNTAIETAGSGTIVRGNLVSGNPGFGVVAYYAGSTATIVGNTIGMDAARTKNLPNVVWNVGVSEQATATVGGTAAADANWIGVPTGVTGKGPTWLGPLQAISVDGATATIQGNRVGLTAAGAPLSTTTAAIGVAVSATNTVDAATSVGSTVTVGGTAAGAGNVLSGLGFGILTYPSVGAAAGQTNTLTVQGNLLGTDLTGTAVLNQGVYSVQVNRDTRATIGGTAASAGNVIAREVSLVSAASGTVVAGNRLGTNAAGTALLAGTSNETRITVGGDAGGTPPLIGGTAAGAANVIAGGAIGITARGPVTIQGNRIGTNLAGTARLGLGQTGIDVRGAGVRIGGSAVGAGNVISGMAPGYGVLLADGASGTVIEGNWIGTDLAGTSAIPNVIGIGAGTITDATIGGVGAGQANVISRNLGPGVYVFGGSTSRASGVKVRGNTMADNGRMAIDLDQFRPEGGGNGDQLPPTITSAAAAPGGTTVAGTVTSAAAGTVLVDVYSDTACDPTYGVGEARAYLGTISVAHPGGGSAVAFSGSVGGAPSGSIVTATATAPVVGTSQFAACGPIADLAVTALANASALPVGGDLGIQAKVTNRGAATATGVVVDLTTADTATDATFADAPSQGTLDLATGTWTVGTLAAGASATVCLRKDIVRATTTIDLGGTPIEIPAVAGIDGRSRASSKDPFLGNDSGGVAVSVGTAAPGAAVCPLPTLSVQDASVVRPASGTAPMPFTVTLSAPQSRPVTVRYATRNGLAVEVEDYLATSGTLTFAPGETSKTVSVPIVGNRSDEPDKAFVLDLSAPFHASIARGTATGVVEANGLLAGCPPGSTANQRFVCHLYFDALGRAPESGGFAYWVRKLDGGTSRATMARSYLTQPESLRKVANRAYILYLGRNGTTAELTSWADKLAKKQVSTQDIRIAVLASAEYYARTGGTNEAYIRTMFRDVFRRSVDSSGLAYWSGQLTAGKTRTNVASRFMAEPEGRRKIVGDIFLRFLRRDCTVTECMSWVNQLAAGKTEVDVGVGLVASNEYYARPEA